MGEGPGLLGFAKRWSFGGKVANTRVSAGVWLPISPIPAEAGRGCDRKETFGRNLSVDHLRPKSTLFGPGPPIIRRIEAQAISSLFLLLPLRGGVSKHKPYPP
jgi:hypothetical protein